MKLNLLLKLNKNSNETIFHENHKIHMFIIFKQI